MDFEAIGKTIKQTTDAYQNIPDAALGEAYAKKMYPAEYQKFTTQQSSDISAGKELYVAQEKENLTNKTNTENAKSIADDIEAGGQSLTKISDVNLHAAVAKELKNRGVLDKYQPAKLTLAAQTRHDNILTAFSALDAAENNIKTIGGPKGLAGIAATIPIIGQYFDPEGAAYHDTMIEVATQMAKAITNSSRPPESVINRYMKSLPDVSDNPKYAYDKLNKMRNELHSQAKSFKFNDIVDTYKDVSVNKNIPQNNGILDMLFPKQQINNTRPPLSAFEQ